MDDVSFSRIPADALERWTAVRDVVSGDQAVRAGSYLPYLNAFDQSQANIDRNNAYRTRAVLYPATGFTLEGLLGLAFRVDPQAELPEYLKYLETNADGAGTSIYQQSQDTLSNNLQIGRHGLYVDYSTKLQKPVIKPYASEHIINWGYSDDDAPELNLVVLYEEVEERERFSIKKIPQWRELRLEDGKAVCRIYRRVDPLKPDSEKIIQKVLDVDGMEVEFLELRSKGKVLNYIPFAFVGSQNNDASIDHSPLYGLAQVNLAHFRNSADYEDSVFFVGQVQPWISGLDVEWRNWMQNPMAPDADGVMRPTGQKIYVGSRAPMLLPENGAMGFAQAQPNTLVKEAMDQKEEQMVAIGARMIEATQAGKTATGENNDREATTSVLSMCVSNVNEAYQKAINWCAAYLDKALDASATYKINQDFVQAAANPAIMAELVKGWQTGIMAKNDVRDYFRKLGLIATERSDADIENDLEKEGPSLGGLGGEVDPITGEPIPPKPGLPGQPGTPGGLPGTGNIQPGSVGQPPPGSPQATGGKPDEEVDDEPPDLPKGDTREEQIERTQRGFPPRKKATAPKPDGTPATTPAPSPPSTRRDDREVIDLESRTIPATLESTPPFDLNALVSAVVDAIKGMQPPTITINMPEQQPPVVNMAPITVEAPQVTVTPPVVNVASPTVNVEAPVVNVTPGAVNVEAPNITVPITVEGKGGGKTARIVETPTGYELEVTPTKGN